MVEGVYKVPKDLAKASIRALDDFRNKKLFDFGFNDPDKIEFKDGARPPLSESPAIMDVRRQDDGLTPASRR